MTKKQAIQLFQERKVRTLWDDQEEKWYFCVVDVVEVLTDSKNPTDYIKKMRKRDPMLAEGWGQLVTPLAVQLEVESKRLTLLQWKASSASSSPSRRLRQSRLSIGWHRWPANALTRCKTLS